MGQEAIALIATAPELRDVGRPFGKSGGNHTQKFVRQSTQSAKRIIIIFPPTVPGWEDHLPRLGLLNPGHNHHWLLLFLVLHVAINTRVNVWKAKMIGEGEAQQNPTLILISMIARLFAWLLRILGPAFAFACWTHWGVPVDLLLA